MEQGFSRDDTKVIKGVAIILMLAHHLWGFPERICEDLSYLFTISGMEMSLLQYFGIFGKICVSLYFFWGGYGTYLSSKKNSGIDFVIGKIKRTYIAYWKVFLIFVPIAFLFFSEQPTYCETSEICHRYAIFSKTEYLNNFLGLSYSYNSEWWFLKSYICAIITFPLIKRFIDRHSTLVNVWSIIIGSIVISSVLPALGSLEALGQLNNNYLYSTLLRQSGAFTVCFWMGCALAKDNALAEIREILKRHRLLTPPIDLIVLAVIVYMRMQVCAETLDILYAPLFSLAALDILQYVKPLRRLFHRFGAQSTNMWLIHTFFCYYFYRVARLVVWPRWGVPCLLILIALTYVASLAVTWFWKQAAKLFRKIAPAGSVT